MSKYKGVNIPNNQFERPLKLFWYRSIFQQKYFQICI